MNPAEAWAELLAGNQRFVEGRVDHPHQDAARRADLAEGQAPIATIFGCSDSRLAAELIFDRGLGDLFVVRNAGQVISDSVIGSLEYAVSILGVPLIVVLGHDACGAVAAAMQSTRPDATPFPVHIARIVRTILPAVHRVRERNPSTPAYELDPQEVGREHLRDTIRELLEASPVTAEAVADGRLAVVGANYRLAAGRVEPDVIVGLV
ncbi:MAG: carbonic anhydrase [Micrococcales bacterium 73-13]|nr:MAG: carbonic anhydrase [Micrococcales bacterium 73-13]